MTNPSPANDSGSTANDAASAADDVAPTTAGERAAPPTADGDLPVDPSARLTAVVVEHERGPDECTIYPYDASEEELVTTWITAREGTYVSLDEMR